MRREPKRVNLFLLDPHERKLLIAAERKRLGIEIPPERPPRANPFAGRFDPNKRKKRSPNG